MADDVAPTPLPTIPEHVRCEHCGETRLLADDRWFWYCEVCARHTPKAPEDLPGRET